MEYVKRVDKYHSLMLQNLSDNSFCDLSLFRFYYYCSILYFKEKHTRQKNTVVP